MKRIFLIILTFYSALSYALDASAQTVFDDYIHLGMEEALKDPVKATSVLIFGDDNSLKLFKKKYKKLINLEVLHIIGDDCSSLSEIIPSISTIKSLRLNRCELTEVPDFVSTMTNLVEIDLAGNNLTEFPYQLGDLPSLTYLTLGSGLYGGNQFTHIDLRLSNFSLLKSLYLFQCPILEVPAEIGELQQLEILSLSQCELTTLPNEMGKLTSLKSLTMGYNKFESLPTEMNQLINLEEFYCITETLKMDFSIFSGMTKLKEIGVSLLDLEEIPQEIVKLRELKVLRLANCNLIKVDKMVEAILDLSKIEELYLFQNKFTEAQKELIREELSDLDVNL